jgi:hypothetical protein
LFLCRDNVIALTCKNEYAMKSQEYKRWECSEDNYDKKEREREVQ